MKNLSKRSIIIAISLLAFCSKNSFAQSDRGNGGDILENQFQVIAQDIKQWISRNGAQLLKLPENISLESYQRKMLSALNIGMVSFTSKSIIVNGIEKACVNKPKIGTIVCNIDRFTSTSESDRYVLVHHEYAGLAGLESNVTAKSDYSISNQITKSLERVSVLKLVVRPAVISLDEFKYTGAPYSSAHSKANKCHKLSSEFMKAACLGDSTKMYDLIQAGENVNNFLSQGEFAYDTALIIAARENHSKIVKLLIEHHADLDFKNDMKRTALLISINNQNLEITQLLIDAGANVNLPGWPGFTPLASATIFERYDIVSALLKAGAKLNTGMSALSLVTINNNVEVARTLIRMGADINYQDKVHLTPLLEAIYRPRYIKIEMIKMLLEEGANLEATDDGRSHRGGATALIGAASTGYFDAVKLLVEAGADIHAQDEDGNTALKLADKGGHTEVVNYLKSIEKIKQK